MGKVRMLHLSSGRDNFDVVTDQATNQNAAQTIDKKEIEEKTKDAIKAAIVSQPQTSSNDAVSNK